MSISRGIATFTLDNGKCPRWLFDRMVRLGREMIEIIAVEIGPDEFIKRIADPVWFQSLGTVLAFDWNASGLTTVLTAALKEAIRGEERNLGIFICGGKGKTSLKTPEQIKFWSEKENLSLALSDNLVYSSKMSAKVDSALVQDGYQLYHHTFFFSRTGSWAVVQQGMNEQNGTARRYHWFSDEKTRPDFNFVCEPHYRIISDIKTLPLNLVAQKSEPTRDCGVDLVGKNSFNELMKDVFLLEKYASRLNQMARLKVDDRQLTLLNLEPVEYKYHPVIKENFRASRYLQNILWKLCDEKPEEYEKILATQGVGAKTMRALALIAEVIYGAKPSYEDPARYGFALGGKDGTPYFVDRPTYDATIELLRRYVNKMKIDISEKNKILSRLKN